MNIPHFGTTQNLVFLPALLTALVPTLLVVLPVVFAPALVRRRGGRVVRAVCFVLAALALVPVALQAGVGMRVLADERLRVQQGIEARYGLHLDDADVHELIDGGKPEKVLPQIAAKAGLEQPQKPHTLKLVPTSVGSSTYDLTIGDRPWPTA